MFRSVAAFLFVSSFAFAQSNAPAQTPAAAPPKSAPTSTTTAAPSSNEAKSAEKEPGTNLPPETAVITIKHLCSGGGSASPETAGGSAAAPSKTAVAGAAAKPAASSANCNTVITKAEFEKIVNAVVPKSRRAELPPTAKQQIAQQFSTLLVMATTAQKRGIERKDPNVQEALKLSRQQVLASSLNQDLMEQATPSDTEIKKYYDENPSAYDEVTLQRLFIPKATAPTKDKPSNPDAEKADAEKLRGRAAAGEDFDKLQKEAFASQPNPQGAPSVQMGPRRRGAMPPDQESAIFATSAGSVTQLFDNPAGWYVYKVVSKRAVPLADVKEEILHKLQQQRYMDARNAITNSVQTEFNEKYFGSSAPEGMHMPGMNMPSPKANPAATPKPKPPSPAAPSPGTPASPPPPQH